jgi:hypothetical protein
MSANIYLPPAITIPGALQIINITQTNPMIITIVDSDENTYIVGQLVHLSIPPNYGMTQANQLTGQITEINGLDFTVSINASQFDAFILAGSNATLAPGGSRNIQFSNFTNKEPFQNLSNTGN